MRTRITHCKNSRRRRNTRKAILYTIDAILASVLLLGGLLLLLNHNPQDAKTDEVLFLSQDVLNVLSELRLSELNNSFIAAEIANGNITNINKSVLEQAGEYWALNETVKANELISSTLNGTLDPSKGLNMEIAGESLLYQNHSTRQEVVTSTRMISGISKGVPLTGASASAYLKKIRNKKTSSYFYFGGFVGQGNITAPLFLPGDFNSSRLVNATLKIETPGTFTFLVNGNACAGTYAGIADTISAWDVSSCSDSFIAGRNNISLQFISSLNTSYVSGGFLRVIYTTDVLNDNVSVGYTRYYFPEISGLINLYDSISAQGIIQNWTLNISFYNQYDTFLTLGNDTIFIAPGQNITQQVYFVEPNVTLAPLQIPLRLGISNLSNISVVQTGLPADSFLITDVSGSMGDCVQYQNVTNTYCSYEYKWGRWRYIRCIYPGTCNSDECHTQASQFRNYAVFNQTSYSCNATKLDIAKAADALFVGVVLNASTLNNIGLVDFSTSANTPTNLSNNAAALDNVISNYHAGGGTCTCCGVNRARDMVNISQNKRFLVILSDGDPTYYCKNFSDYSGSAVWGGDPTGGSSDPADIGWAINASKLACQNNITVFTVGFGSTMSAQGQDTMRQMACNDSLYYNATDVTQLAQIYQNISQQILLLANFTSQTLQVSGNYSLSQILPNSYIDVYYDPLYTADVQNKLSLVFESPQFNGCNATIQVPQNIGIIDAFVTSFSGNKWTKTVRLSNSQGTTLIYNLSAYGTDYSILGDPFQIQIPSAVLLPGENNTIMMEIGDASANNSNCSANNTLIYTGLVQASTPRTNTVARADGCIWTVESETGSFANLSIPQTYTGNATCNYTHASIAYDPTDAYDLAAYQLFTILDPSADGRIILDIWLSDLEIQLTVVRQIPYLWGPSLVRMEVWR